MPPALANLYCLPSDVYDDFGTSGGQLALDDGFAATGQTVQARADAVVGATTISVTALQYPLLAGSTLEFAGAGMPAVQEAIVSQVAATGATMLNVLALPAQVNAQATATDNGVNTAFAARLLKACKYATAQVKLYCCGRYNDSDLVNSWSVNRWATALAKRWLARRRKQACPKSVEQDADEALSEMRQVQIAALQIEDIGTRTSGWPFLSNCVVDIRYDYAKIRVEQPLSEGTPTQYGQFIDWNSALFIEY